METCEKVNATDDPMIGFRFILERAAIIVETMGKDPALAQRLRDVQLPEIDNGGVCGFLLNGSGEALERTRFFSTIGSLLRSIDFEAEANEKVEYVWIVPSGGYIDVQIKRPVVQSG